MNKYNIWMPCGKDRYQRYIKSKVEYELENNFEVHGFQSHRGLCLNRDSLTISSIDSPNYKQSHKIIDYNSQLFIALSKVKEKESVNKLQVGDIVIVKNYDHKYYDELLQITKIDSNRYAYFDPIESGYIERKETINARYNFSISDCAYLYPPLTDIATRLNTTILINKNDSSITSNSNNDNNPSIISYY